MYKVLMFFYCIRKIGQYVDWYVRTRNISCNCRDVCINKPYNIAIALSTLLYTLRNKSLNEYGKLPSNDVR